jgi:hypothetical protein
VTFAGDSQGFSHGLRLGSVRGVRGSGVEFEAVVDAVPICVDVDVVVDIVVDVDDDADLRLRQRGSLMRL